MHVGPLDNRQQYYHLEWKSDIQANPNNSFI